MYSCDQVSEENLLKSEINTP